jgi:hypothetical protein
MNKKWRWLPLGAAILGILETPHAIAIAVAMIRKDHSIFTVATALLAFTIRFLMIGWLSLGWWKMRPAGKLL